MASTTVVLRNKLPDNLQNDDRNISDLWIEAVKNYQGVVGIDLGQKFPNVEAMIESGTEEMSNFHKYRHNNDKVDKLRTLFSANLDLLEKGSNQIIAAASPAFPPAAAIGTALTYILKVSAETTH
jgi:hypothetical protein